MSRHDTDRDIIVTCAGETTWIPQSQSQIDDDSEVYKKSTDGTLIIPRWLAEKKGFPYRERRCR